MKSLQATRKKQIDAVLTPEQKKTWSAWKKNNVVNAKANKATKVKVDEDDIDAIQD
jgi:Spy/CpxP family protein refolding chaperone